eukprot:gene24922-5538_t
MPTRQGLQLRLRNALSADDRKEWAHHGEDSMPGTRFMPAHPELVYRRTGEWKGWAHFLGQDTAENRAQDALEDK